MEIFSLLAVVWSMTGLQQYDFQDIDKLSYTVQLAQDSLGTNCIPRYDEATQINYTVKVPLYCGLEITTNVQTGKTTMSEDTFDIVAHPYSYSWIRANFNTNSK